MRSPPDAGPCGLRRVDGRRSGLVTVSIHAPSTHSPYGCAPAAGVEACGNGVRVLVFQRATRSTRSDCRDAARRMLRG